MSRYSFPIWRAVLFTAAIMLSAVAAACSPMSNPAGTNDLVSVDEGVPPENLKQNSNPPATITANNTADTVNPNDQNSSAPATITANNTADTVNPNDQNSSAPATVTVNGADDGVQPESPNQSLDVQATTAVTITVNSTADTQTNDGACTLREAIINANNDNQSGSTDCTAGSGADTITFSVTGTITLVGSTLPFINSVITIDGPGAANLTISGDANANGIADVGDVRVLRVTSNGTLDLRGVTIANGVGGPDGSGGGGIGNRGGLITISDSTFVNNQSDLALGAGGADGGAISNREAGTAGPGGTIIINSSTFLGNKAGGHGGAIFSGAAIDANTGQCNPQLSTVTINNSTFTGNTSLTRGGGIGTSGCGSVTVDSTTFDQNSAVISGGGINNNGILSVTRSTFSANSVATCAFNCHGGGINNSGGGVLSVTNSTFSGNSAGSGGGGLHNGGGDSPRIMNITFSGNIRTNASGTGGGAIDAEDGSPVVLVNSIVANSQSSANCSGPIVDRGDNLQFGGTIPNSCGATIPTADPMLSPLALNPPGNTKTHALLDGSPAIDAVFSNICPPPATDQRGVLRPQGSRCDKGAYEAEPDQADLSITKTDSPDPVTAGATLTYTLLVSNAGPLDAANVVVTDTLPAGVTFVSATPAQTSGPNPLTWNLGALTTGSSTLITITVTVDSGTAGTLTNSAVVTTTTSDANSGNNSDSEDTTVNTSADLSIVKSDTPDPVIAGQTLTYTLAVNNAGPSNAASVTVTDTLPAGVTFVSASGTGWTCRESGGMVTCTRPSLAVGAAPDITIVVTVNASTLGGTVLTNTAQVSSSTPDPEPLNNSDSENTTVIVPPCELYPIALHTDSLAGLAVGDVIADIFNGAQPGNFGWLTWAGSPDVGTLITSLTPPGDSDTYVNPNNPNDRIVSIGDWVQGKPGVSNSSQVRAALDVLKTIDIVVPVWDISQGNGANTTYHVVSFARVRLTDYQLPGQNRISARFLGVVVCSD